MWPTRRQQKIQVLDRLRSCMAATKLQGLSSNERIESFVYQIVASLRREDYYQIVRSRPVSILRTNPHYNSFNAEAAVAYHVSCGNDEEAYWLIFLMTCFGKNLHSGWDRLRDFYGACGADIWSWARVASSQYEVLAWYDKHWAGIGGAFGNHRKYETLNPKSCRSFRVALIDYCNLVSVDGQAAFFKRIVRRSGNNPEKIFQLAFDSLHVTSFGRLAKFDYLTLVNRFGLAPLSAGHAYLQGATGPTRGAKLLFDDNVNSRTKLSELQKKLDTLDQFLEVGMVVLEDSLCNWQKSPDKFLHFRG
jgi:hypothetical protein